VGREFSPRLGLQGETWGWGMGRPLSCFLVEILVFQEKAELFFRNQLGKGLKLDCYWIKIKDKIIVS
jgi:hypothetical protein